MSLDIAISSGKEWRRPYKSAKLYFRACRNHGRCSWCRDSRMYSFNKNLIKYKQMEKEFVTGCDLDAHGEEDVASPFLDAENAPNTFSPKKIS